jgi:hypothetical protein
MTEIRINCCFSKKEILNIFRKNRIKHISCSHFNINFLSCIRNHKQLFVNIDGLHIYDPILFNNKKKWTKQQLIYFFRHFPCHQIKYLKLDNLNELPHLPFYNLQTFIYDNNDDFENIQILYKLLEYNQQLLYLKIDNFLSYLHNDNDILKTKTKFLNIISSMTQLESLDIPSKLFSKSMMTSSSIKNLDFFIKYDESFYFNHCLKLYIDNLDSNQMKMILETCPNLENVVLCGILNNIQITEPHIQKLNHDIHWWFDQIPSSYSFNKSSIVDIYVKSKQLKTLHLCNIEINHFILSFSLKSLNIHDVKFHQFVNIPMLTHCEIENNYIDSTFAYLYFLIIPNLKYLMIRGINIMTIPYYPNIYSLTISNCIINTRLQNDLSKLKSLRDLTLFNNIFRIKENEKSMIPYMLHRRGLKKTSITTHHGMTIEKDNNNITKSYY